MLTVDWGYETTIANQLVRRYDSQFLVPQVLRPRKRGGPCAINALPGYVFTDLEDHNEIIRLRGICDHVQGYVPMIGNMMKPATITQAIMDEFTQALLDWNATLMPEVFGPRPKPPGPGAEVRVLGNVVGTLLSSDRKGSVIAFEFMGRMVNARRQAKAA